MTRWRDAVAVEYGLAVLIVGGTTAAGLALRSTLGTIDVVMLYLLAVVLVAVWSRPRPALLAAALSVAAFDFCFVPPYYTFNVQDRSYYLTFAVMLIVAMVMGRLASRIRDQARDAGARERLTAALYRLNHDLAASAEPAMLAETTARHLRNALARPATVTVIETIGDGGEPVSSRGGAFEGLEAQLAADLALKNGLAVGWGTDRYPQADVLALPLRTPGGVQGLAMILPEQTDAPPSGEDLRTLEALAREAALALERARVAQATETARLELATERLRTALLSSLSHDFRSPLSTIEGAASSLVQDGESLSLQARLELAETIHEEARRLHRMVNNLLDMVRVEAGLLAVHKSWQPLDEVLGVALIRLDRRLATHPVSSRLDPGLPLVHMDELLIEQLFINLLENAARHTPPGTAITVSARAEPDAVEVEVRDEGPGIPPDELEAVFERFHRVGSAADPAGGAGLGLTICRGIVTAHGGRIWIVPDATGTAVRFTIPFDGQPPPVIEAPPDQAVPT